MNPLSKSNKVCTVNYMAITWPRRIVVGTLVFIIVFLWCVIPSTFIDNSSFIFVDKVNHRHESEETSSQKIAEPRSCDLLLGKWMYDPVGPLYTNNTCNYITSQQNCQGNGRPDRSYENWRWKPHGCDLPRFDAGKFLELMRGKTLAFVGDSVARNQMESLLCILSQFEVPRNRGGRRMQRLIFGSTSTTISRVWSSWLVRSTNEPDPSSATNKGVTKVHLDTPDYNFLELLPGFDVVVVSSGHWFGSRFTYVVDDTVVKMDNVEAYGVAMDTALGAVAALPGYKGLTVVRSYSPDHYRGGAWNSGGTCSQFVAPEAEPTADGYADAMHVAQVASFERAKRKARNGSRLRLMDVTELSGFRHDGHPGPYSRSSDSDSDSDSRKNRSREGGGRKGAKEDCLHWCMPGPVDTWNEILFEILRGEL